MGDLLLEGGFFGELPRTREEFLEEACKDAVVASRAVLLSHDGGGLEHAITRCVLNIKDLYGLDEAEAAQVSTNTFVEMLGKSKDELEAEAQAFLSQSEQELLKILEESGNANQGSYGHKS